MKDKLFKILICGFLSIGLTGCGKNNSLVTANELNEINNKIIKYFQSSNVEYDNLSFNYVDDEKNVVVVGLLNNSEEEQNKFKTTIVDSEYIIFVQGKQNINEINIDELNNIKDKLTDKVSSKENYSNFASCGVDKEKKVVIVELVDNSEEQQEWFKKNIMNSKYIKFVPGGPYQTSNDD